MATETTQQPGHKRRSSLTEAFADISLDQAQLEDVEAEASPKAPQEVLQTGSVPELPVSPWSNVPDFEETSQAQALPIPLRLGEPRKSGVPEATESPFTPEDSPVYELYAGSPTAKSLSTLASVPEESSQVDAEMVKPDALQLPALRTPRKAHITDPALPDRPALPERSALSKQPPNQKSGEDRMSVDFSAYCSGDLDAFNPFANLEPAANEAQDLDKEAQAELSKIPEGVAHLDFGSRHGGGVVGPKLGRVAEREADKFEVQEGEDAEIKQLLWVIENLQEELHISNRSFGHAEQQAKERQAVVDRLEDELTDARAQEAELSEKLNVIHSQLEAQLLTNLEQEEDIRMSGEKLKATKSEIAALDEQLAAADIRRKQLKGEAATRRAKTKIDSQEKQGAVRSAEEAQDSPRSDYSSAWETSESDVEGALDLGEFQDTRPSPTTIFEDNHAKMNEKGAKGGSWLRSVLGSMGKKEDLQHEPDPSKRTIFGAAHSHFEQPSAAAELRSPEDEEPGTPSDMPPQTSALKS